MGCTSSSRQPPVVLQASRFVWTWWTPRLHGASWHVKVYVHQGCFVTTHSIHGTVHALISCIRGVCDNVSVPLFYLYLVLHRLRQLSW